MTDQTTKAKPGRKIIVSAGVGMITGLVLTVGFFELSGFRAGKVEDLSIHLAALIGVVYVATGLTLGAGVAFPGLGARFLNVEDAGELREQRRLLARSGAAMGFLGAFLIVVALGSPEGPLPPGIAAIMAGVCTVVVVAAFWGQAARTDELMRQVSLEGSRDGFYLTLIFGGSWAAAAHLRIIAAPAAIDWLSVLGIALLLGAFTACRRRGLINPR